MKKVKCDIGIDLVSVIKEFNKTFIDKDIQHGRYKSYEHCRKVFIDRFKKKKLTFKDKDYLALHLFSYLASWGMLRNSFLERKDYTYLIKVVEILFNHKTASTPTEILDLKEELDDYFKIARLSKAATQTLLSKIILGTLGIIVAYDRFVRYGLKKKGYYGSFGPRSLEELNELLTSSAKEIDLAIKAVNTSNTELYTPMKILDMYFFYIGFKN